MIAIIFLGSLFLVCIAIFSFVVHMKNANNLIISLISQMHMIGFDAFWLRSEGSGFVVVERKIIEYAHTLLALLSFMNI
jgi:hypothetical protein